jgi:hypothetical protein
MDGGSGCGGTNARCLLFPILPTSARSLAHSLQLVTHAAHPHSSGISISSRVFRPASGPNGKRQGGKRLKRWPRFHGHGRGRGESSREEKMKAEEKRGAAAA